MSYGGPFLSGVLFEVTTSGMWFQGYWWWVCPSGQRRRRPRNSRSGTLPGEVSRPADPRQRRHLRRADRWAVELGAATPRRYRSQSAPAITPAQDSTAPSRTPGTSSALATRTGQASSLDRFPLTPTLPDRCRRPTRTAAGGIWRQRERPIGLHARQWGVLGQLLDGPPSQRRRAHAIQRLLPAVAEQVRRQPHHVRVILLSTTWWPPRSTSASHAPLNKIWYYSPPNTTQLATECGVWDISTRKLVATNDSPSWSGDRRERLGLVRIPRPDPSSRQVPGGPLQRSGTPRGLEPQAAELLGFRRRAERGSRTARFQRQAWPRPRRRTSIRDTGQEPGQCVFAVGPPNQYPNLYVDGLAQNYWVDMEVTPASGRPVNESPVNSGAFLSFFT